MVNNYECLFHVNVLKILLLGNLWTLYAHRFSMDCIFQEFINKIRKCCMLIKIMFSSKIYWKLLIKIWTGATIFGESEFVRSAWTSGGTAWAAGSAQ